MKDYSPSGSIDCYLVVPPQYRPQLFTAPSFYSGTNLRAIVSITERRNENLIPLASGRTDVYQMGPVRRDVSLQITGADEETEAVIDEIITRNIPVYIYPRAGGNVQLNLPLVRGLGVDPIDGPTVTHTLTARSGTTIYMPRADSGHGLYLEAVDESAPLVDGVWATNGEQTQLPTGRGMPFWKLQKNLLLNSLISGIIHEAPYTPGSQWGAYTTAADVWDADHGIKLSPWCADANSYWTTRSTTYLRSYTFTLSGGTNKSLSFCYRVDGIMNVSLKDSGGTTRYSVNITTGSGRAMIDLTGLPASYAGSYLQVALASGSYCEFSCPQLIDDSSLDCSEYQPFLGTESGVSEAEITASSLVVSGLNCGADSLPYTGDRDGVLLVSGYCQPMFSSSYLSTSDLQTLVQISGYGQNVKLNIGYDAGSGIEWGLYYGGTERQVAAISDHQLGDIYAWGVWSGYADGIANTQMYIVRLRDGTTYGGSYIGSMVTCHTLRVGSDSGSANCDCVLSGITIESMDSDSCVSAVTRLADESVRNVMRSTIGRWYLIGKATSPRPGMPYVSEGQYVGTEIRVI